MQQTPEMMMTAAIDAIRQQVLAEMKAQEPAAAPQRCLLTASEAGLYLGRSTAAIRMMTYKRQLPCIRDGRSVRFDIRDLDARIDDQRV
ncbi:MAG TPA: helix-turn-helix domain-containing protein [Terriglobales bacterium]